MNYLKTPKATLFEKATEAARKAGAFYPKAVAEFLKDRLVEVETAAGPTVMASNGLGFEPLEFVMAQLQTTKNVGALFTGDKLDVRTLEHELYRAIRKHNPELLGLR